MEEIGVAQAKAHLSELLDRVEAGETVTITRHGRAVARLSGIEARKPPIDFEALTNLRRSLPSLERPSADLIREMRDQGF